MTVGRNKYIVKAKKLTLLCRYFFVRLKALLFNSKSKSKKNILIDLAGLSINRRVVQVVLQLHNSGYSVYYKAPAKLYVNSRYESFTDYQEFFYKTVRYDNPKIKYQVVFCGKNNSKEYQKQIIFCDEISFFGNYFEETFFFPILFHPIYLMQNHKRYKGKLLNKINMLFVGNCSNLYSDSASAIHQKYGIETRNEVIDFLLTNFSEAIFRPKNIDELFSAMHNEHSALAKKIVVIDRFRLEGEDYWTVFQHSAFHIWTCGYVQPYCHNQVESMSCGSIPIYNRRIKYPDLNENNSYPYDNLTELADKVKILLEVDINSELILKKNKMIEQVFNNHFSNEAFDYKMKKFINSDIKEETYYICEGIYE